MEFDPVSYAMGQAAAGPSVEVEALSATENKTYTAPSGKAYSPVTVNVPNPSSGTLSISANGTYDVTEKASAEVNVPNTYAAGDEGKVVSSGALVAQTSKSVTSNGTVDTTTNNSVTVAVPNPNSVTTITGTLANPWGDTSYLDIASALATNSATVEVAYDASAIGAGSGQNFLVLTSQSGTTDLNGAYLSDQQQAAYMILFAANGSLSAAYVFDGANLVDISEYASVITTQVTITWHPMPT